MGEDLGEGQVERMRFEFGTHLGDHLVSSASSPPRVSPNLKTVQLSLRPLLLPHARTILPSLLLPVVSEHIMADTAAWEGENACAEKESSSFSFIWIQNM